MSQRWLHSRIQESPMIYAKLCTYRLLLCVHFVAKSYFQLIKRNWGRKNKDLKRKTSWKLEDLANNQNVEKNSLLIPIYVSLFVLCIASFFFSFYSASHSAVSIKYAIFLAHRLSPGGIDRYSYYHLAYQALASPGDRLPSTLSVL